MNDEQLLRYSRHIMLAPIDVDGQQRLIDSHALIVGAGGLGAPAALYLSSAGVGTLTICDGDAVDLTNLQRQIIHRESTIGVNKAVSAARAIADINHDCRVIPVQKRVGTDELSALIADADIVLDCSDNFATRHAVNIACVDQRKPLVSGAAIRFSGQVVVFDPRRDDAPCYECLFPSGDGDVEERCAVMGVFAPLTGVVGTLQAAEAIRLLIGMEGGTNGELVLFDAQSMDWQRMRFRKDPACRVCSNDRAEVHEPVLGAPQAGDFRI